MSIAIPAYRPTAAIWTGRIMSALIVLFLTFDGILKLTDPPGCKETMKQLGFSPALDRPLGFLTLTIAILCALPSTALSGAVLLTAYLGGAIASHLRVGDPVFTHLLFGVYIGILAWGGLWLRDSRLRRVFPFNRG